MIFIDTSVWISSFRSRESENTRKLSQLLSEGLVSIPIPVVMEILTGCSKQDQPILRNKLSALPIYYPELDTWRTVEKWIYKATSKGKRFGITDLLIAAIATEKNAKLWSFDKDFMEMKKLGFVDLF